MYLDVNTNQSNILENYDLIINYDIIANNFNYVLS